jgi:hypothetical protein
MAAGGTRWTWGSFLVLRGILAERRTSKYGSGLDGLLLHAAVVTSMTAGGWADTFDHDPT